MESSNYSVSGTSRYDERPILPSSAWQQRRASHFAALLPFTRGYRLRRGRGESHPIYDFLFTYYAYSSSKLEQWHPGYGVVLEIAESAAPAELRHNPFYDKSPLGITLSKRAFRARDIKQLRWVKQLCATIAGRTPRFSCLGLHEWAMVYRTQEIRHEYPLRLSPTEIAAFLDTISICCSHFDAFRFFSPAALKLNVLQPTAESRIEHEQGGCVHANMDLYKWAFKLSPLISSDLLRECFMLAVAAREIDMRASPYDFASLGFTPIKIESPEGQEEYRQAQRSIAERASKLRRRLLEAAEQLLAEASRLQLADIPETEHTEAVSG